MRKTKILYRSSITGFFVSKEYSKQNPATTTREVTLIEPKTQKDENTYGNIDVGPGNERNSSNPG